MSVQPLSETAGYLASQRQKVMEYYHQLPMAQSSHSLHQWHSNCPARRSSVCASEQTWQASGDNQGMLWFTLSQCTGQFQPLPDMLEQPYQMLPRCCLWQKWGSLQQTQPFDWKECKMWKSKLLYDSSTKRQTLVPQLQHTTHVLWYATTPGHDKLHPVIYSLALQDPL